MMKSDTQGFLHHVLRDLPENLWGRDVLQGMGIILCSPNSVVSNMMLQQAFDPCRRLGKTQQERLYLLIARDTSGTPD
jgi:hypothetical protein